MEDLKSYPTALQPFIQFGIELDDKNGNQRIGDCPFCSKEKHFFVNEDNGNWQCKRCSKEGGIIKFLEEFYSGVKTLSNDDTLKPLSTRRGLPTRLLKHFGIIGQDPFYFVPMYSGTGELIDVKKLNLRATKPKFIVTKTRHHALFNIKDLVDPDKATYPIYICEGEFDAIALYWLFERIKYRGIVVGIPGTGSFKSEWIQYFIKRNVKICLDNDTAGDDGIERTKGMLDNIASTIQCIHWDRGLKQGYDISDFVSEWAVNRKEIPDIDTRFRYAFDKFQLLFHSHPRNAPETQVPAPPQGAVIGLEDIIQEYKEVLEWNYDLEILTKVFLATTLSVKSPGTKDPVWLFVVGPPGYGKTTILLSSQKSALAYHLSNVSSQGLISGWSKSKTDPSILAKINNKCFVFKDWSEILKKNELEKQQIISIFWGAFDGEANRDYGQGLIRRIKSKFSLIAGVTRKIYGEDQTSIGDRFLRYNMQTADIDFNKQQETAMRNSMYGDAKSEKLSLAVAQYLGQQFDFSPDRIESLVPQWFKDKLRPMCRLLAHVRTPVERHQRHSRLSDVPFCDPVAESGNRISVQLQKLAWSLAIIENKEKIDLDIYAIIKRIAVDTIYNYNFRILKELVKRKESTIEEIAVSTRMPSFGVKNCCDDLLLLNLIDKEKNGKGWNYSVKSNIKTLWNESCL